MNLSARHFCGVFISKLQFFLLGKGFYKALVDGQFGPATEIAVKNYQKSRALSSDGVVGERTMNKMVSEGFPLFFADVEKPLYPPFAPLLTDRERSEIFGTFRFRSKPERNNPENVQILGDWEDKNIIKISPPQLTRFVKHVRIHRLFEYQFIRFWNEIEYAGLMGKVLSFDGAFVPRFIRGSRTTLSNHAFGSAFDINCDTNSLGTYPPTFGTTGCVRELVPIAHKLGLYWGGHFSRRDGMHFEVAVLLKEGQILDIDYPKEKYSIINE